MKIFYFIFVVILVFASGCSSGNTISSESADNSSNILIESTEIFEESSNVITEISSESDTDDSIVESEEYNFNQRDLEDLIESHLELSKRHKWVAQDNIDQYNDLSILFGIFDEEGKDIGFLTPQNHYAIIDLTKDIIINNDGKSFDIEVNINQDFSFNYAPYENQTMHFEIGMDDMGVFLEVQPIVPENYSNKLVRFYREDMLNPDIF